jgi:hypothetical protein
MSSMHWFRSRQRILKIRNYVIHTIGVPLRQNKLFCALSAHKHSVFKIHKPGEKHINVNVVWFISEILVGISQYI